jgi:hypothetical protein
MAEEMENLKSTIMMEMNQSNNILVTKISDLENEVDRMQKEKKEN